jgi:hypothetical protein
MAAEMDAVSFMMEIVRMEDSEWVVCMSRFTMMTTRQHSTHLEPGRLFYNLMDASIDTICHVAMSMTFCRHLLPRACLACVRVRQIALSADASECNVQATYKRAAIFIAI